MDQRWMARTISLGRCIIGAGLVIAPQTMTASWLGDSAGPGRSPLARGMGVRDLALGLGALEAMDHEGDARMWVAAGAASDVIDAAALVLASGNLPRRVWGVVALAAGAAILGGRAAADLA